MEKVMDAYEQRTFEILEKHNVLNYVKNLMNIKEMPDKNKLTLLMLKFKDAEKLATEEILHEAVKRKEALNDRWKD